MGAGAWRWQEAPRELGVGAANPGWSRAEWGQWVSLLYKVKSDSRDACTLAGAGGASWKGGVVRELVGRGGAWGQGHGYRAIASAQEGWQEPSVDEAAGRADQAVSRERGGLGNPGPCGRARETTGRKPSAELLRGTFGTVRSALEDLVIPTVTMDAEARCHVAEGA